jgi:putative ABC transport system permease protein
VLRALGLTRRECRAIVRWQSLTAVALGVALGLPLGFLAGRGAWRVEADRLGIASDVAVPFAGIVLVLVATLVVGFVCTALPARRAARLRPAGILRSE